MNPTVSGSLKTDKTTVSERTPLRNTVNLLVAKKGLNYSEAYHIVHQRFGVESIEDLSQEQVLEAVEYVHRMVLDGEILDKEMPPAANLNDYELTRIAQLLTNNYVMMLELHSIIKPMMMLGARFHDKAERYLKENLPLLQAVVHGLQRFRLSDPLCAPEFDKHMAYLGRANLQI